MPSLKKTRNTCPNGHTYFKSTDCPTCPECEEAKKPTTGFLSLLSAPARRALENEGITTLNKLSGYSEKEILKLHGMGKGSIPTLTRVLAEAGLSFKTP
jgi:DNA-directed RNA polymerase alpha subunit